jgi:hypothetical protein
MDNPDDNKFVAGAAAPVIWVKVACVTCRHLNPERRTTCRAFPNGIPREILNGENDHHAPVAGDQGIQYERFTGDNADGG